MIIFWPFSAVNSKTQLIITRSPSISTRLTGWVFSALKAPMTARSLAMCAARPTRGGSWFSVMVESEV